MSLGLDKALLEREYGQIKAKNLHLDMSRGKPCAEITALSDGLLKMPLDGGDCVTDDGAGGFTDCRNYGVVEGIYEARKLFAPMLGVSPDELILGNNSSLSMMYDAVVRAMTVGVSDDCGGWLRADNPRIKFLCPTPGYDRHFAICESLGIEMLPVPAKKDDGDLDMDLIEELAANDGSVKGIWCTPIYSNPTGRTYSDETVRRFARMRTKAADFRVFWDCAYIVHHLSDSHDSLLNILDECKKAGNPERVYMFASTSKITLAGGGVAMMAASAENTAYIKKQLSFQTIGSDKINQLRHVRFLKDFGNLQKHMKDIQLILRPKFDAVLEILDRELTPLGLGKWHSPKGGYFISFDGNPGTAKKTVSLCREAGVVLTRAGATFPYGKDPDDRNIRIAPSLPPISELKEAMNVFCLSVKLANL